MPLIYRAMTREGDRPKLGPTARTLGVRPRDIPVVDGSVAPGTGGMSVAPSWRDLPSHRIPRRLARLAPDAAGSNDDACWRTGEGPFGPGPVAEGLALRPDKPTHGLVEPSEAMSFESYQAFLEATRDEWRIDEE
jgi:hypothetical protein